MRYINFCSNSGAVQTALDEQELGKPYVVYLEDEKRLDWNSKSETPPLSAQPLTFEIISGGTIMWKKEDNMIYPAPSHTIEYSVNNGPWSSITSTIEGVSFPVQDGDIVRFRGNTARYSGTLAQAGNLLSVTGVFKLYGNICSLMTDDYVHADPGQMTVARMFSDNTGLTEVSEIAFGNNMLARGDAYCFAYMFQGCTNLNYVKCLLSPSYNGTSSYFPNWLNNTASEGTFVKKANADWSERVIPAGWTIIDAEI
jgi:hypothetical protein